MATTLRLAALLTFVAASTSACLDHGGPVLERRTDRSYPVSAGSLVRVELADGPITVETGDPGEVRVQLLEQVYSSSDRDADDALRGVQVAFAQQRDEVKLVAKREDSDWRFWRNAQVHFSATLTVPADVRLNLDTSGGRIRVRGERSAEIKADTSGGSVSIDGGTSAMNLDTSGGSITVGTALSALDADTSGGSIRVGYIGPRTRTVVLSTSGGGIRVGIDADAALNVNASTSGGSVEVDHLPLHTSDENRSSLIGLLNGGGGQLRATTSGGNIHLDRAQAPRRANEVYEN
jgi:DUF4097 and DUF4098 domain-containing protein YvlB